MGGFDPDQIQGWTANYDGTDAVTNQSLKAAPGSGVTLVATDVLISNDSTADITWKLLDGSGGTNLTGTQKLPVDGYLHFQPKTPIELTANTALCLTTTGTSNFSVFVAGHLAE